MADKPILVRGIDGRLWVRFKAFVKGKNTSIGEEVVKALTQWMDYGSEVEHAHELSPGEKKVILITQELKARKMLNGRLTAQDWRESIGIYAGYDDRTQMRYKSIIYGRGNINHPDQTTLTQDFTGTVHR